MLCRLHYLRARNINKLKLQLRYDLHTTSTTHHIYKLPVVRSENVRVRAFFNIITITDNIIFYCEILQCKITLSYSLNQPSQCGGSLSHRMQQWSSGAWGLGRWSTVIFIIFSLGDKFWKNNFIIDSSLRLSLVH